jgi:hypothetical protein
VAAAVVEMVELDLVVDQVAVVVVDRVITQVELR